MSLAKTALTLNAALILGALLFAPVHAEEKIRRADAAELPLPPDIDPVSRYRLPLPTEADMRNDAERKIFEEETKGGLPPLRLTSPLLAKPLGAAHNYLKFHSQFDGRQVEIAVLQVSRSLNDQFEWTQWEEHGQAPPGGKPLTERSTVDIIKYCKPLDGLDPQTAMIIQYGRELLGPNHQVSSPTFAKALALWGKRGVVDMTDLMALYVATATELDAYDTHLYPGQKPLLPALSETPLCPQ